MLIPENVQRCKRKFAGLEMGMDYSGKTNQELENLIEQKDMEATCEMAERCLNGTHGVEQNLNRAYQLFHRGESNGSKRAYQGLAYMYENGILFAQNIDLAKEYYAKAGIEKTVFAAEQVRMSREQKVAEAIARAETPATVKVSSADQPEASAQTMTAAQPETPVQTMTATQSEIPVQTTAFAQPETPVQTTESVQPAAPVAATMVRGEQAELAASKALEAAEAAKIAAVKAQEAARAAELAAEYAQKACQ